MGGMRRLRLKCLLGLTLVAALVTLLSPYPFTSLHTPTQETQTTPYAYLQHARLPETALGRKTSTAEERSTNRTPGRTTFAKSPAEARVEEKIADVLVKQEELEVSQEGFVENPPPPKEWVEVKKTHPKEAVKNKAKNRFITPKPVKILGYSSKVLKERALSFPESSSLLAFLKEQTRRAAHVAATCRSFQPSAAELAAGSRGPPVGLLSIRHIIYDKINQLTFCPVYKAASTSWTRTLLQLGGHWGPKTEEQQLQKLVKMFYPRISGVSASTITEGTTHFMVVRHPLGRLLSCYRDKFEHASKDYYYNTYGEKMVRRYRPSLHGVQNEKVMALQQEVRRALRKGNPVNLPHNPFANPLGPTFPEFVEYVINSKHEDEHWKTYTTHCAPCSLTYDFVLRFESLQEENKWFLEYLNRSGEVTPRWDNHNPTGSTNNLVCDYYGQLTLRQIDELITKYSKDMLLYEYDAEDYRKCAKDYVIETVKNGSGNNVLTTTTAGAVTTTSGDDNGGADKL